MEIFQNHPLAPYTTLKIGGPADTLILTHSTEEFINALSEANNFSEHSEREEQSDKPEGSEHRKNLFASVTILGNGSNVLISDKGIRGTVIINKSNIIEYLPNNQVKVDSGVQLPLLISQTVDHSLSGLEEFAYIPSSIGGAIVGNIHGVNKNNFDKFLVSIETFDLDTKELKHFLTSELNWSYDFSSLQNQKNLIVISAILQLSSGNKDTSRQLVADIITKKTATQSMNSLGCVFKNPQSDSAGRIIDQELGLKGFQIGQAQISPKHANFVLNLGGATASDYYAVIQKIIATAKSKGYDFQPEIKFLGEF